MVQTVRYQKGKKKFELLTNDGTARKFRDGNIGWNRVLVADQIFTDSKKGNIAKDADLIAVFGTSDIDTCAQIIIKEGDLQVSAAERRAEIDAHKGKVMGYIHRTYMNAQDHPYPHHTIKLRLEEAKIRIDPLISVQKLADEFVKKMQGKMVLRRATIEKTVVISYTYAKKAKAVVGKYCNVTKQTKDSNGITWKVDLPRNSLTAFMDELNAVTDGGYQLLDSGEKPVSDDEDEAKEEPASSSKPWKKGKGYKPKKSKFRNKKKGRDRPLK